VGKASATTVIAELLDELSDRPGARPIEMTTVRQERMVSRAWGAYGALYALPWSCYRATAGIRDEAVRTALMERAEQEGWTETRLRDAAAAEKALEGAGTSDRPDVMPVPADYDSPDAWLIACWVYDGKAERAAAALSDQAARWWREWEAVDR
jgi:hypothetical protein